MSSQSDSERPCDQHVLAVAQRLYNSDGESALTMNRLAAESGISRATLYRRFGGRTALLKRLVEECGMHIRELDLETDISKRILQAARTLVSRTGSINFTVEQVATEAGVGVATVYRHFGTKEFLLRSMAEHFHPRRVAQELISNASDDLAADLKAFAISMLKFMQSPGDFSRLLFSGDDRVRQLFRSTHSDQERTLNSLSRYLEAQMQAGRLPAQDPFDLSTAFLGMIMGFAFVKPTYTKSQDDPVQAAHFIVRLFLAGIQKDNP